MANVVIRQLYCVHAATGTDAELNQAVAALPGTLPAGAGLAEIANSIQAIPGLIAAIDNARSDPDDLYLTTDPEGGLARKVWPRDRETQSMQSGQSTAPNLALGFEGSLNISLWDYDSPSDDDLLGSVTVEEGEIGQELMKKAFSEIESSVYYVHYLVY